VTPVPRQPRKAAAQKNVSLKTLADHLHLSPTTISLVLNESPSADSIPQETKDRVLAAAREFNYRPNFFARSLRKKKTMTVGILIQDMGEGYGSLIINGIEGALRDRQYLYLLASHHHRAELLERYINLLLERGVEGFIVIDTDLKHPLPLPTVAISGHRNLRGVTNIVLDHKRAAEQGLSYLKSLGHSNIVVIKGQSFSSDSEDRWRAIMSTAKELGVEIRPELCTQLEDEDSSPQVGYPVMRRLLDKHRDFTAVFAYNDISAIGSIRALTDVGMKVPEDVSVIGFDDIQSAAFHNPSLTTVRQPLRKMGEIAATALLERLNGSKEYPDEIAVEPELIVRESTQHARVMVIAGNGASAGRHP
jgi:DNA-binding LacI/PurR family transcriptional regulator